MTLFNLSAFHSGREDWPVAVELLERAVAQQRAAYDAMGHEIAFRSALSNTYWQYIHTLLLNGNHARAASEVSEYCDAIQDRWQEQQYGADFLLRSAFLAASDPELSDSERAQRSHQNTAKAESLIQRAIELGFPVDGPRHPDVFFTSEYSEEEFARLLSQLK